MSNILAIIPAKANSQRVPNKNLRDLCGMPLWFWSVAYAHSEGIKPVVSTDSEDIIKMCASINVDVIKEEVNDSKMSNCIKQALEKYPMCKWGVLLQPTSPIRCPGMLYKMVKQLQVSKSGSYTCEKVKPQGKIMGEFRNAFRSQDQQDWIYAFDGNILIFDADRVRNGEELLVEDSLAIVQSDLYNLQIDTESQYSVFKSICDNNPGLLPFPARKQVKTVCVVSNKTDFKRNYTKFVDSCDVVIRTNKMDGLPTGACGTKTDICVTGSWFRTLLHTPEERKDELLAAIPRTYFSSDPVDPVSWRLHKKAVNGQHITLAEYPAEFYRKVAKWTSFGKAVWLARHLFPSAQIFLLCDMNVVCRSGNNSAHIISSEVDWINSSYDIQNINEELVIDDGLYSVKLTDEEKTRVERVDAEVQAAANRVSQKYSQLEATLKQQGAINIGPYTWKVSQ